MVWHVLNRLIWSVLVVEEKKRNECRPPSTIRNAGTIKIYTNFIDILLLGCSRNDTVDDSCSRAQNKNIVVSV